MAPDLAIEWLGRVPYREALELQAKRVEARRHGAGGDVLLLLEHPPVITLGRRARREHLLVAPQELAARGIEVHEITRGGDVTYHGPGQLVGYLIVDLEARGRPDVGALLGAIQDGLIDALAELGVAATGLPGLRGVFVAGRGDRPRKIASIGIGLRGWVSYHGFALNVGPDLSGFGWIVPCGLHGIAMTSVARELGAGAPGDLEARARAAVARAFAARFGPGAAPQPGGGLRAPEEGVASGSGTPGAREGAA